MRWHDSNIDVGDGTRLRPWRIDDLDALVRHADDERISRGTSDRFPFPYTRADGEAFLSGRVVGFDDLPDARHFMPPLTTVRQDFEALGALSMSMLLRAIEGDRVLTSEHIVPTLLVRESTAPAAR